MGAKAWFIAFFDEAPRKTSSQEPKLDREASAAMARRLLPKHALTEVADGDLSFLDPGDDQLLVGCYPGLSVVALAELGVDFPSRIDPRWHQSAFGRYAYLHATHSVVDWFAFAVWKDGKLIRSLSISPDNGIQEQIGETLPFEKSYWEGKFPAIGESAGEEETYPLPFHPLELSEASMLHHMGFQFEGRPKDWVCEPSDIPIRTFRIEKPKPRWKFW